MREAFGVELTVPLLSDPDHAVIDRYGLLNMGTATGPRTRRIPNPTTLIIDEEGTVRWRAVETSWKVRPTNGLILAALARVRRGEDARDLTLESMAMTADLPVGVPEPAPGAPDPVANMVMIPAGAFTMGEARRFAVDTPEHDVQLDAYYIDEHEVTNADYRRFLDHVTSTGDHTRCSPEEEAAKDHTPAGWSDPEFGGEHLPVVGVDWFDAAGYCGWAGKQLPSEAQWERAARVGLDSVAVPESEPREMRANVSVGGWEGAALRRDLGEEVEKVAGGLKPVGSYDPDAMGLFDMRGNAEEWCRDWYDPDYYSVSPRENPSGPDRGVLKASRGNSWHRGAGRPAQRYFHDIADRLSYVGFRCVRPVSSP